MNQVLLWENLISQLAIMGVKSVETIKALMRDAGLDDATIQLLTSKWDDLYNRVKAASGQ